MRLNQFVFENRKRNFEYGEWDCLQMAGELLEGFGHHNPYAKYRGKYGDELEAYKIIRREAGTLEGCINRGFKPSLSKGIIGITRDPKDACVLITGKNTAVGLSNSAGWLSVPVGKILSRFECLQ